MAPRKKAGKTTGSRKNSTRRRTTQTRRRKPKSLPQIPAIHGESVVAVAEPPRELATLSGVYEALAGILVPYAKIFEAEMHPKIGYCLKAKHGEKSQKECYFGGVQLYQDHVSFHLFLLYAFPDLEESMSEALASCQKGVTSFEIERGCTVELVAELERLTHDCFERFRTEGLFGEVE